MADWNGTARSNYFQVKDEPGFVKRMEDLGVAAEKVTREGQEYFWIQGDDDHGDFPSTASIEGDEGEDDEDIDFWLPEEVAPFLADGQVAVFISAGAEKLRYITGTAVACCMQDNEVKFVEIALGDIYNMAEKEFGIMPTPAEY